MMLGLPRSFWAKVLIEDRGHDTPCLIWAGPKTSDGYAAFVVAGHRVRAHRLTFEAIHGRLPVGVPDHLCRVTLCVNASHLEDVTNKENILRGNSPAAKNARKTHCDAGHEFTKENTRLTERRGGIERTCRACHSKTSARSAARRAGNKNDG